MAESKREKIAKTMGTKFGQGKVDKILKSQKRQEEKKVTRAATDAVKTATKTTTKAKSPTKVVKKGPAFGGTATTTVADSQKRRTGTKTAMSDAQKMRTRTKTDMTDAQKIRRKTPKGQAEKGASPLANKPRTIAEAKKRGELYFFDSKGVKKLAVTKADLDKTGLSLREYANKFAKKKQTKKQAESLKGFAATKKRGGGVMKKKSYAGGGAMKKKGMAAGGRNTMKKQMMRGGGMGMMKKKMMAGGGAMKKKGYAIGGAMKKKGMKRGGKPMKMRGGGLATRGTNFTIR